MGLYDDLLEEQSITAPVNNANKNTGLYDDLLTEQPKEPTFAEAHPFVASLPEAGKQLGLRAVKSFPEFGKGLNDLVALAGDKTGLKGVSDFGRFNAQFWQEQADKIQIDPKYQGLQGLKSKSTFLPTLAGEVGGQASNLLFAGGGGAAGAKAAAGLGLKGVAKAGLITAGTAVPNLAQEGQYLDKIDQFYAVNGRMPTDEELKYIQNVAIGEKAANTALETVSDRLLFGKLFPSGTASKGVKDFARNIGQQAITEAGTEGLQESVSIGAENLLGINQGNNLERLGEAMALGGLTGGVIGGVTSAVAQPYETQFPENQNAINPVEAVKNVSAQILDNGKVLYNSAADTLNNAMNQPDSFDTLRQLSRDGAFSHAQQLEQIAPDVAKKAKAKKGKSVAPETIINNSPDVTVQDTGMPNLMTNDGTNLYNVQENGESQIVDNNTVKKIAKDVKKNIPEEVSTAVLERPVGQSKSEKKAAAKQAAIEKLRKIAPDVVAKHEETTTETTNKVPEKLKEIAPDVAAKVENTNKASLKGYPLEKTKNLVPFDPKAGKIDMSTLEKVDSIDNATHHDMVNGGFYKLKDHTEQPLDMVKGAAENTEELIARAKDLGIKGNLKVMKSEKLKAKIAEAETKVEPQKHIWEGWTVNDFIEELEPLVNQIYNGNSIQKPFKNRQELKKWCMDNQPYYKKYIPDVVNHFANKHNIPNEWIKEKESEVLNGHVTKNVNAIRPELQEKPQDTSGEKQKVSQRESTDASTSDEVGRTDNIPSDNRRGISKKDLEIINKEYKNQHELNKAIEDYINNGEYKKYAGSISMPQEVKDWLKKYAGAGGLEKQGAEGKGLLSEYYTPKNIVDKMWDLTAQYVDVKGAKVLEPSVGIGRFLENSENYGENFDVAEMNPVSAMITKILYPNAKVTTGEFQERFINKTNNTPVKSVNPEYDIVIGNPPYGQYSGRYKGMGEGKVFNRMEAYFINRGLDLLKENGVMTFIVPSSFLDSAITTGKQEISKKCELLDAYRLPENTFDTTTIGTDIIVLRKKTDGQKETNINLGKWFEQHPEKILGEVDKRKSRYGGKMENFVKGDKNAVDSIDTSKKDIKETVAKDVDIPSKNSAAKTTTKRKVTTEKNSAVQKGHVEYNEYQHENVATEREMELWEHTTVDGSLKGNYKAGEDINQYDGKLYNDFNYLQGNIYEKLDALEYENISDEQKAIQKKKLESVLPEKKTASEIMFNPTSDFIREYVLGTIEKEEWDYFSRSTKTVRIPDTLDRRYNDYVGHLTNAERNGVSAWDIKKFIQGDKIRIDYRYSSYSLSKAEKETEKKRQQAEYMTRLKQTVDKTFNDFIASELTKEEKEELAEAWNRQFNNTYNPDYNKMPMIVKGLSAEFNGQKLALQNVQVEGVNFLTNKGVGLLGFEVGVGKTLTGIISTVQNMQMGRCKKPLILVPKQVKNNWIREINQAFPNIKVNDVGNMSKFKGEIDENTLTVATYEALGNIWYGENSAADLINKIYSVSNDFNRDSTKRGKEKTKERAEEIVGIAEGGNKKLFNIQDIGFDHITVDEAHNFRNLFKDAKADGQEANTYVNISAGGKPTSRAARLFLLSQYILENNGNRNVFMLTATPFNNSPLEVFNMLSFLAKNELDEKGLYNVYQFMENYADISSDWIVNSRNEVEYKQVVTGFKNASSLRELIKSVMLIRSAEDAGIVRPDKYTKRVILEPSQAQLELIAEAESEAVNSTEDGAVLKAINQSRKATLSPDIASDNFDVEPKEFIENSPKLNYVMKAVASMKKKDPRTSQLIYMPLGVRYLPKIKQYLIDKGVYKEDEVEIIVSGVSDDKITEITDSFNDREGKVKLIIGTDKIKEGMNLNKNSSVLYIPYMDWNPTDFVQVVGRIWRRGNRYSKIRVVVPLLKNSSDSFMFQKLNEKTDRINNIMDESKEYIDTSELNTAEEKINMISNPEKKMKMFIQVERQKLTAKENDLKGRLETSNAYQSKIKSDKSSLKNAEERLAEFSEKLKDLDPETNKWDYEYTEKRVKEYKRDIANYKWSLKKLNEKIERLELDFEGKDSEAAINSEIEKIKQEIQQLEKYGEEKLVEFVEEYEKERASSKTIDDLIKDFENDTIELYGEESKSEDSKPLGVAEPQKKYEKTREAAYSVPVIELETKDKKVKKSRTKIAREKAEAVEDATKYNKALKNGVAKWKAEINTRRYAADKTLNNFVNITRLIAKDLKVNDKHLREIMPFLRERTSLPEKLNRPELEKVWEVVHARKGMPEKLTGLADELAKKFDRFYQEYKAVQASSKEIEDSTGVENYVPHDWKKRKDGSTPLLSTAFITSSRHAKKRTIPTYYEGIQGIKQENGEIKFYEPETLDYAILFKKSSDNLIKAAVDKTFADSVKSFKADNGASLVLPASQAPSHWVEINNSALNKMVARPVGTSFGEKISPELVNKLAEMGVAIGNRLSKFKGNGQPNSLGKFVKNQPPEIRLQKWFSTKTLAHEVGHALDNVLGLQKDGFVERYRDELLELNKERIEAFAKQGDRHYAEKDSELIAELFGVMFNDIESALKYAPSATSEVMAKMTDSEKLSGLLPGNFDWSDAKHVIEEKVVEFFKMPVKVHPDIAATLKTVFENKKEYIDILGFRPGEVLDNTNAVAKMVNFSLSGFHAWALSESYIGNVGAVKGLKESFNFKKIFNSVKNNDYDVYKQDELVKQAISDGLEIGTPLDVNRGLYETVVENTGDWLEKNVPYIGKAFSMTASGVNKATEINNKVLWDVLHNNYKIGAYRLFLETESQKGIVSPTKRREIAQWVNDSFGGLVWENLGISPSTKKFVSRWLMSPDWLISTTRQFMGMFSSETLHRKLKDLASTSDYWNTVKEATQLLGINSITDDVQASGMRGRIARAFWVRSAIYSCIYMNVLNALFRAWDKEENPDLYPEKMTPLDYSMVKNAKGHKLYIFIGRNKDGTERYLRLGKQFREVPEMVADPLKHFGNKVAPIPQAAVTAFTGKSMGNFENKEISEAKGWKRVGFAAKNLGKTYLPYSVSGAYNKIVKGQGADFTPFDLIGNSSKGMTPYKAKEEYLKAYEQGAKPEVIKDIDRSMRLSGYDNSDITKTKNQAKGKYNKQFKDRYIDALNNGDKEKIKKISNDMKKKNVSPMDQRKIYAKAFKEFRESRGN